jgi:transcriptional regulator with XRE-family HTH domain
MNTLEQRGEYIREKRKAMGLTQEQLGEMIGVTSKTISKWENGESETTHDNYKKLADVLKTHLSEIMAGKDMDELSEEKKLYIDQVMKELSERIDENQQITIKVEEHANEVERRGIASIEMGFYAFGIAVMALFLAWYAAFPKPTMLIICAVMWVFSIAYMIFGKRWIKEFEKKRQVENAHTENK